MGWPRSRETSSAPLLEPFSFPRSSFFGKLFTSTFKVAKSALKNVGKIADQAGLVTDSGDVIQQIIANDQIKDEKERLKDQLNRQLIAIEEGQRKHLQQLLSAGWENSGETKPMSLEDAKGTTIFQTAMSGAFLIGTDGPPTVIEQLADEIKDLMKHTMISAIIQTMGWSLVLDGTILADDPSDPGGACRGNKGIANFVAECGLFRRNGNFAGPRMQDPGVIGKFVDIRQISGNAVDYGGGVFDPDVEMPEGSLPKCTYNFKISNA